jgi:F-type H+-transporting ATPase subunit b
VQIDWLTVAAQIVNFLVLVWLLQRFLYRPIASAMRRREERIERRLAEAAAVREAAEDAAEELKRKEARLEARRAEILDAAREEARALEARLEADLRAEMEERRETWHAHLAEERAAFVASLRRQAGQRILEITERILAEYAGADVTDRVVATFTDRLRALEPEMRAKMSEAAAHGGEPAVVHTGAAIGSAARGRITRAIHEILSADVEVEYREDPDMVLGIRLTLGDYTAEWSAVRYLERLQAELGEIIDAGSRGRARPGTAAGEGRRTA